MKILSLIKSANRRSLSYLVDLTVAWGIAVWFFKLLNESQGV